MRSDSVFAAMSTATYYQRMPIEDIIPDLAVHGIYDAELFLNTFSEYEPSFIETLVERATESGVRVCAVHPMSIQFEPLLFSIHPRQYEDALRLFEKVLQGAAVLGAGLYVMHGPPAIRGVLKNAEIGRVSMLLGDFSDIAAEYGVTLCLENVSWCLFQSPDFGKAVADRLGDRIHFTLDIKQSLRSGYTPDDYIDAVGPLIRNVHLCDYEKNGGGSYQWKLPGQGCFPFGDLFQRLRSLGYKGPLSVEGYSDSFGTLDEAFASYRFVRELADRIFES